MSRNQFLKDKVLTVQTLKILVFVVFGLVVLSKISNCRSSDGLEKRTEMSSTTLVKSIKMLGNMKVFKLVDSDFATFHLNPNDTNSLSVKYQYKAFSELFLDLSKIQLDERIENDARKIVVSLPALQVGEVRGLDIKGIRCCKYSSSSFLSKKKDKGKTRT